MHGMDRKNDMYHFTLQALCQANFVLSFIDAWNGWLVAKHSH